MTDGLVPTPNFVQYGISYSRFSEIFEADAYCKSESNEVPVTAS